VPTRLCAKDVASAFQNRADLRTPVCNALQRLCLQNRRVLREAGAAHLVGPGEPQAAADAALGEEEEGAAAAGRAEQEDVPPHYTQELAARCRWLGTLKVADSGLELGLIQSTWRATACRERCARPRAPRPRPCQ
jgi:hypothetical protein